MDRRQFLGLALASGASAGLPLPPAGPPPPPPMGPAMFFNRRILEEAHQKMAELAPLGITAFAFTPTNGWVIVTQTGAFFARNIPQECFDTLAQLIASGVTINCVAFPPAGGNSWVITGNGGFFCRNAPQECADKIAQYYLAGQPVIDVAFPPGGGNSWTVATATTFFARNIDDECFQMMRNLTQGGRLIRRVGFPYTGGWVAIAQDEFFSRNIDPECVQQLNNFILGRWEANNIAFSPVANGWSISSRGLLPPLPPDPIRQIERIVGNGLNIWSSMDLTGTPGAAVAMVMGNQVAWATAYGWLERGQPIAAHPESAFQACSVSKAVASVGFMRLVQNSGGALALNTDVRPLLNWPLGQRPCVAPGGAPTIDLLLAHRSGVIGRGSTFPLNACAGFDANAGGGFGGYGPGPVPTLLDVLNGLGNSPRVELSQTPGLEHHYSGAGFVVLQRMLEQITGQTLAQYMANEVFAPLGMTTSSYDLNPPFQLASGHVGGVVIPGRRNRYPESAAAGLYTNVLDLSALVGFLNRASMAPGDIPGGPLTKASVTTMLNPGPTPTMGRGIFLSAPGTPNFNYYHTGSNLGFKSEFRGYPNRGMGYAILCNGDDFSLVSAIGDAIRAVYALPA